MKLKELIALTAPDISIVVKVDNTYPIIEGIPEKLKMCLNDFAMNSDVIKICQADGDFISVIIKS